MWSEDRIVCSLGEAGLTDVSGEAQGNLFLVQCESFSIGKEA